MKFSRDWLSVYVDLTDLSDDELGRRLTDIGHAIESVEKHGDDTVFDLEITTNRVDAMSHLGMARELAAALGRPLVWSAAAMPPLSEKSGGMAAALHIQIEAKDMCRRYTAKVIKGVTIEPSSPKIATRLE